MDELISGSSSIAVSEKHDRLWKMKNGYALPTADGLEEVVAKLRSMSEPELDAWTISGWFPLFFLKVRDDFVNLVSRSCMRIVQGIFLSLMCCLNASDCSKSHAFQRVRFF